MLICAQLFVRVCASVWLNRTLTLRLSAVKYRAHESHYKAHKKVIERNVLGSFCQNPPTLELRVWEVCVLKSTLLWTHTDTYTHTHTLQPKLTLTPTTTRCLFNDCGGAPLPLKIRQRKKNNIYHFQLPLPLKDTIFTHSLPSSSVGLVCPLCHGDWTLFPNCKMYHYYQHPGKIYKLNCGFHLLPKFWVCLEIQINAINPFFFFF